MIEFQWPWLLIVLPLPAFVWWFSKPAADTRGGALRVPFYARFAALGAESRSAGRAGVVAAKALLWALLVLAASRPVWIGDPLPIPSQGRDLMLALDLSGSMETPDFEIQGQALDRLTVVRAVAKRFVESREGDRMGLVLFGSRAYLQAPLTLDRNTLVQMLDESEIGLAGEETAIGDAIGLAVKHLRDRPTEERVLVLLSDGANNAGVLEPVQAAEIAAQEGIRIYTIGLGTGARSARTFFGNALVPGGGLDEATLQGVAQATGGEYFRARDTASLVRAHQQIDALETVEGEVVNVHPSRALFHWPLAAFLLGSLGLLGVGLVQESVAGWQGVREGTQAGNDLHPGRMSV
ncbi:MAG: VWA domain-containing protein [Myxococcota bacterium]|jgi:Ca-activated chloride channel family protein|nr:VWA domain-containing protein [Myxococcota bacterium]